MKEFDGENYMGTVTAYIPTEGFFHIKYDDSDEEVRRAISSTLNETHEFA